MRSDMRNMEVNMSNDGAIVITSGCWGARSLTLRVSTMVPPS